MAIAGGKIIGSSSVIINVRLAEGIFGEIASLVVSEKFRGNGVGTSLIQILETHLAEQVDQICIRANAIRDSSHNCYRNKGYRGIKEQKVFVKALK